MRIIYYVYVKKLYMLHINLQLAKQVVVLCTFVAICGIAGLLNLYNAMQ